METGDCNLRIPMVFYENVREYSFARLQARIGIYDNFSIFRTVIISAGHINLLADFRIGSNHGGVDSSHCMLRLNNGQTNGSIGLFRVLVDLQLIVYEKPP